MSPFKILVGNIFIVLFGLSIYLVIEAWKQTMGEDTDEQEK